MNKPPTTKTVVGGRERRGRIPDASIPDWAGHKRRGKPTTERQRARKAAAVGEARRNDTVELVRSWTAPARRRGGAKYGPAPKRDPHPGMQAPKPMGSVVRTQAYLRQDGRWRLTPRQDRQINRMVLRNADRHAATDLIRDALSAKGRPTPKRGAR